MQKISTEIGTIEIRRRKGRIVLLKLPKYPPAMIKPSQRSGGKASYKDLLGLVPDLSTGTPFQKKVWKYIRRIPYGHTVTYREVAEDLCLGRAYRAVGQACKTNPMPIIIPCHRIVAANGKPGGYSSGLRWKRYLLRVESCRI